MNYLTASPQDNNGDGANYDYESSLSKPGSRERVVIPRNWITTRTRILRPLTRLRMIFLLFKRGYYSQFPELLSQRDTARRRGQEEGK